MDAQGLETLLDQIASGTCSVGEAVTILKRLPFSDLGFAQIDHHRALRQGLPEAVYAPQKTPAQCGDIVVDLLSCTNGPVMLTRANPDHVCAAQQAARDAGYGEGRETTTGATSMVIWRPSGKKNKAALLITAGTADLPVATECEATLEAFGVSTTLLADCGVAGMHRLLAALEKFNDPDVVIVFAGMEGALASVVGGIVAAPVIAVPTSVGYGSSFEGITALLAMMSSCAAGVAVVGIDNGFGAASAAARLLLRST